MGNTPPEGLVYQPDFVSTDEEEHYLGNVTALPFSDIKMRGQVARRRTAHFGWLYGYESWRITPGPPMPDFLVPLRARAATLTGVAPEALAEVLLTEYQPGAGIGWHRDAPQFGVVVGVSLLGACRMRFQRGRGEARQTAVMDLE